MSAPVDGWIVCTIWGTVQGMWTKILNLILGLLGLAPKAPTVEAVAESTGEAAGKAKAENTAAQDTLAEVKQADAIRQEVRSEVVPGKAPEDDGFRRD